MARKKLNDAQRAAIKKEILKKLAAGDSRTSVGRQLSKKYGVSTVTIRWYIKTLKGGMPAASVARSRNSMRILDIVKNVSEEGLARALAAKKLFVQLQQQLAQTEQLRRSLDAATARTRELEKKLQRLTTR